MVTNVPRVGVKDDPVRQRIVAVAAEHEDVLVVCAGEEGISPRCDLVDDVGSPSSLAILLGLVRDAFDRVECIGSHAAEHEGESAVCATAVRVPGDVEVGLCRPSLSHSVK